MTQSYKALDAWQLGMTLAERCYMATDKFPSHERYGLSAQMRRAAVSIPSNLAEGFCRRTTRAYANHVSIALGSHGELETCIELAVRLGFIEQSEATPFLDVCTNTGKVLSRLHQALEAKMASAQRPSP